MTTVRRRVLRSGEPVAAERRRLRLLERKHQQLIKERDLLKRWMTRLKRAFHAMEKLQAKIARLERQISELESQA